VVANLARIVAERVADEIGELRERLYARVARADEDEPTVTTRASSSSAVARPMISSACGHMSRSGTVTWRG